MIDQRKHVSPEDVNNPWFEDGSVDYDRVHGSNPAGGSQYPKMLFRYDPGAEPLHGVPVATTTVDTDGEEEAMRPDGWRSSPTLAKKAVEADPAAEPEKRGPGRPRSIATA